MSRTTHRNAFRLIAAVGLVGLVATGCTSNEPGTNNAANTARLLGGALRVRSDGLGKGAAFTLELPRHPPGNEHDA